MNEYSEDTGLESNPDGYTTTVGQMVPAFEETALSLGFSNQNYFSACFKKWSGKAPSSVRPAL